MNEEAVNLIFDWVKGRGYQGSKEEWLNYIYANDDAFNYIYDIAKQRGYQKDQNSFGTLIGRTTPVATTEPAKTEVATTIPVAETKPTVTVKSVEATPTKEEPMTAEKKEAVKSDIESQLLPVTEKTEVKAIETPSEKMVIKSEAKVEPKPVEEVKMQDIAENVSNKLKQKIKNRKDLSTISIETLKPEIIKIITKEYTPEILDNLPEYITKSNESNENIVPYEYKKGTKADIAWGVQKKVFPEAVEESKDWYESWYKGRKELPEFKDVASKRLDAVVNNIIPIILEAYPEYESKGRSGALATTYREKVRPENEPYKNKIYISNAIYPDEGRNEYYNEKFIDPSKSKSYIKSESIHEVDHWLENNYPQTGTNRDNIKDDKVLNEILPEKYLSPNNESDTYDLESFKGLPGNFHEYVVKPNELRARLQIWREFNNISPTKKYSEEEIKGIIDKNIEELKGNLNSNEDKKGSYRNIIELFKAIHKDPKVLQQMNEKLVETDKKQDSKTFDINPFGISKTKTG